MNIEIVIEIGTSALLTVLYVVGPPLGVAMAVGLVIAVFQAATQVQETSLTFVPKIVAVGLTLLFTGPWSINHLVSFVHQVMEQIVSLGL